MNVLWAREPTIMESHSSQAATPTLIPHRSHNSNRLSIKGVFPEQETDELERQNERNNTEDESQEKVGDCSRSSLGSNESQQQPQPPQIEGTSQTPVESRRSSLKMNSPAVKDVRRNTSKTVTIVEYSVPSDAKPTEAAESETTVAITNANQGTENTTNNHLQSDNKNTTDKSNETGKTIGNKEDDIDEELRVIQMPAPNGNGGNISDEKPKEKKGDESPKPRLQLTEVEDPYNVVPKKFLKLLISLFIAAIVFGSLVTSKLTLLYLTADQESMTPTLLMQLMLGMGFPLGYFILINSFMWWIREKNMVLKPSDGPRVGNRLLFMVAIMESLMESFGLCILVLVVLPKLNRYQGLGILCALAFGPLWFILPKKMPKLTDAQNFAAEAKKGVDSTLRSKMIFLSRILLVLLQMTGIALLAMTTEMYWEIPVAIIFNSVSFWRNFVSFSHLPENLRRTFRQKRYGFAATKSTIKLIFVVVLTSEIGSRVYDIDFSSALSTIFDETYNPSSYLDALYYHLHVASGFTAYYACWIALVACMQILCLTLPVALATPTAALIYYFYFDTGIDLPSIIIIGTLWLSAFLFTSSYLRYPIDRRDLGQLEQDLFADPGFTGIFIEQSMALNRRRKHRAAYVNPTEKVSDSRKHITFIMTTMYREGAQEMRNLMNSLYHLDLDTVEELEHYEAHITFDNAMLAKPDLESDFKYPQYNEWVNQLLEIVEDQLQLKKVTEKKRWYGCVLVYQFKNRMYLYLHLKNVVHKKVKQKKRWSQILYTSIILENTYSKTFLRSVDTKAYLLLMDGDTQFKKDSVDLMRSMLQQDPDRIGAVCGRIFPDCSNPGSNPMVWYQKFEYAAGHWFQKTAEHLFGTVLCCPGCFTLVRLAALYRRAGPSDLEPIEPGKTPIELYAIDVESARDVLKFDQGEDRMLSTLLIQHGWMLQYCSAAVAYTYCPDDFRGFFIQRRRWITSTLANLYHVLGLSGEIVKANSVSGPFMLYVYAVFASSLFSPATIILVIMGGLMYAIGNNTWVWILAIGIPAFYVFICSYFNVDMLKDSRVMKEKKVNLQIQSAYWICFLYVIIMAAVLVGTLTQVVSDIRSPDSLYLLTLASMFIFTGLIHGELQTLIYGIFYLFLLPTMYLILIIFAVANSHDQSWGTRENVGAKGDDELLFNARDCFFGVLYQLGIRKRPKVEEETNEEVPLESKKEQDPKRPPRRLVSFRNRRKVREDKEDMELTEREKKFKASLISLQSRLEDRARYKANAREKQSSDERIQELAKLKNGSAILLLLTTITWLVLILVLSAHVELQILSTNPFGLLFLIAVGIVIVVQFVGMLFHKFGEFLTVLAMIPIISNKKSKVYAVTTKIFPAPRVYETMRLDPEAYLNYMRSISRSNSAASVLSNISNNV